MEAKSNTYISLQILRGIAAWLVVVFHYNQVFFNHRVSSSIGKWVSLHGETGVDIFFVLSGFVMAATATKYSGKGIEYAINRIVRITPNYWFYTGLLILSIYLFPNSYITKWTWSTLFDSLFFIPNLNPWGHGFFPTLYPGWTLTYEMFFYGLLSFCLLLKSRYSLLVCGLILALIPITPLKDLIFLGRGHLQLWEFLAGMLLYALHTRASHRQLMILLGLLIGLGMIFFTQTQDVTFEFKMWVSVLIVHIMLICEPLFQRDNVVIKLFKNMGDYSYSAYLAHVSVIGWFFFLFGNELNPLPQFLVLTGICVATYWVSWVTYKTIETGWLPFVLKKLLVIIFCPIIWAVNKLNLMFSKFSPYRF